MFEVSLGVNPGDFCQGPTEVDAILARDRAIEFQALRSDYCAVSNRLRVQNTAQAGALERLRADVAVCSGWCSDARRSVHARDRRLVKARRRAGDPLGGATARVDESFMPIT